MSLPASKRKRPAGALCLAALMAASAAAASAAEGGKLHALILTGITDLPYHNWRETAPHLRSKLEATGRFDVKVEEEVRGITARTLEHYHALVLHYNGPRWGVETERAVEEFIRSGRGMIAVHGVSYGTFYGQVFDNGWKRPPDGDKGWPAYAEMMGATWEVEKIGHGLRHAFPVKWVDREHPISRGLPETFLANDELYHRMDLSPNAHVLATAFSSVESKGTGKDEPIVWAVPFGKGRVVHITLGHDLTAMSQEGFIAAFTRGTEWAASGAVTLPASR
ncbi:MAG: ThuA domain-containing protein [Bryobacteraceae bacterium]|nr:ThuA domain-containing protein [Bryobacteraceae bacterium]